ncbi:MAG TPA: hypothetical protein VFR09_02425 [Alphaproteobacteria bacterium]|nr:hypothetical protein [Alphaproteobacteria bacterium]
MEGKLVQITPVKPGQINGVVVFNLNQRKTVHAHEIAPFKPESGGSNQLPSDVVPRKDIVVLARRGATRSPYSVLKELERRVDLPSGHPSRINLIEASEARDAMVEEFQGLSGASLKRVQPFDQRQKMVRHYATPAAAPTPPGTAPA